MGFLNSEDSVNTYAVKMVGDKGEFIKTYLPFNRKLYGRRSMRFKSRTHAVHHGGR